MENLTITNEKLYDEMQKLNNSQARGEEKLVNIENQMKRIDGNVHSHCGSIKELKTEQTIIQTELKPIKKFYGKLTNFSLGIIILVGSVIAGLIHLLKEKLF